MAELGDILKRRRPIPTIKSPESSENLLKYALEVHEILRAEFTEKQCLAMEAIEKCFRLIQEERRRQLSDLDRCKNEKDALILNVQQSQSKLDAIQCRQNDLTKRIAIILKSCKTNQPQLSQDEMRMRKDLEDMQQKCVQYQRSLTELTARHRFQTNAMSGDWITTADHRHGSDDQGQAELTDEELHDLEMILRKQ